MIMTAQLASAAALHPDPINQWASRLRDRATRRPVVYPRGVSVCLEVRLYGTGSKGLGKALGSLAARVAMGSLVGLAACIPQLQTFPISATMTSLSMELNPGKETSTFRHT